MSTKISAKSAKTVKMKRRNILVGVVSISASFNNIIVSIADTQGNVVAISSAGSVGFKGSRKSTPYAGQVTATDAAEKAMRSGIKTVSAVLKGPGPVRESALRAIQNAGLTVISLRDATPVPHNGCRPRRRRRV